MRIPAVLATLGLSITPLLAIAQALEVHFLDVGQGDAALIRCPDGKHFGVIDSGDTKYPGSADAFKNYLLSKIKGSTKAITVAISSHAHADHIGSMTWLLDQFPVSIYVDNGAKAETKVFGDLDKKKRSLVQQGKLEYINAKKAKSAELELCPGDDSVTLGLFSSWAFDAKLTDPNDRSVFVLLRHGDIGFLFTGDAHVMAEDVLLAKFKAYLGESLEVHVLKVGHHGSHTSTSKQLLANLKPAWAVISSGARGVGSNYQYRHPRLVTVSTLDSALAKSVSKRDGERPNVAKSIWVYDQEEKTWTQKKRQAGMLLTTSDGTIVMKSDGSRLDVQTLK